MTSQDTLAFCLHVLGIALNYKDDPRLQDTHVLNPFWVTNGIYSVLNAPKLKERKGEIWLNDVGEILDSGEYPNNMRCFLFDLMKKFELCFTFPDDESHYLVPELLDIQEPEDAANFNSDECLNFLYQYDVLPEGLLSRFIVRTHVLSEGFPRWRTGAILKLESNTALVKADFEQKKIFVHIAGPVLGRRRLLAVIRSDFDRIHRNVRNLRPQEMIPVPGQVAVAVPYDDLALWEAEGRATYSVRIFDRIVDLNVNAVLNGVDLEDSRRKRETEHKVRAARLFYCYSHKDEHLRNELETHLKILSHRGLIESWYDRNIEAGDDWRAKIDDHLENADIVLLLVSADFIASDYCYQIEMDKALKKQVAGEARVIPVLIRDVNWKTAPFADLQSLPKDAKPVTEWASRDAAWRNVSEGIEHALETLARQGRLSIQDS